MKEIFLVDKPAGWTSFDVVAKIRGALSQKVGRRVKVGHAGTLDPFATGLLIILSGKETKNQDKFMKQDKEYRATLKLGFKSTTGDPEGDITEVVSPGFIKPDKENILETLKGFIGTMMQTPPAFSALKVIGQRAYNLAREGKAVDLEPRKITITGITLLDYKWPFLEVKVSCSSGTYIRSLAEDIGKALGTGAYLTALRRTKIGTFNVDGALKIDNIIKEIGKE